MIPKRVRAYWEFWHDSHHAGTQPGLRDGHLFSLFLMLPLAYVTLALLLFNWYPSQVSPIHVYA